MPRTDIRTFEEFAPKCYAYTTPQIREHDGWVKIGYTEQDVETRIRQQTNTADVKYKLEWQVRAIYDDNGESFRDKDFHFYLMSEGIKRKDKSEWFYISPEDAKIKLMEFKANRGDADATAVVPYNLREEQEEAVRKTAEYFIKNSAKGPCFLWNAKPRFGKTLTTYELCKRIGAKKVLILTQRPVIATSWYSDYAKFLGRESGYCFVSRSASLKNKRLAMTREEYLKYLDDHEGMGFIDFESLQDAKGAVWSGGDIEKMEYINQIEWDLLVVDEAHEGVKTRKSRRLFNRIDSKYKLHLSGTPFKALADGDFKEEEIFNWTYADERRAKEKWSGVEDGENPYADLPSLCMYTYQISDIIREKLEEGADFQDNGVNEKYSFDLNEFFSTNQEGKFRYEEAVDDFLDALTKQKQFPFSTAELRGELKHTFWLLNRVASAKALERKLRSHPVFKDYKIVLATSKDSEYGDDEMEENEEELRKSSDSLKNVKEAIEKNDKTITLSVRQLTTGVTVPEWTGVLMLSNMKSPAIYMQAAFRAQNPCIISRDGKLYRKEKCYVFDFDPARSLSIFEEFANGLKKESSTIRFDADARKANVRELLNFFPVYAEDKEGSMVELEAEDVLSIPRKIYAREVVRRGFMSNFLFQNISNIFMAPREVMEIVERLEPAKEKGPLAILPSTKDDLYLDEDGEIKIPKIEITKGMDIFGEKIFREEKVREEIEKTMPTIGLDTTERIIDSLTGGMREIINNDLELAKEKYGKTISPSLQKNLKKKMEKQSIEVIEYCVDKYSDENRNLEREKEKEINKAIQENRHDEVARINETFATRKKDMRDDFEAKLKPILLETVENNRETIVEAVETEKRQAEKNKKEEVVRDRLRGFTRTIPAFLMGYGDDNTTLENFDTIIPDDVFREVTGITLEQFRYLRDGGKGLEEELDDAGKFEGGLFDPVVFNDSIKEFLRLKRELADYFDESLEDNIFNYIPPQKTNQIFTPRNVVLDMVNSLEEANPDCFDNPEHTFIDLYMKSGLYIAEIVKKLYNSNRLKLLYPDKMERLNHIFSRQVYGLAPTEIIYRIATSYILGFDKDNRLKSHNFRHSDALQYVKNGSLELELEKMFGGDNNN